MSAGLFLALCHSLHADEVSVSPTHIKMCLLSGIIGSFLSITATQVATARLIIHTEVQMACNLKLFATHLLMTLTKGSLHFISGVRKEKHPTNMLMEVIIGRYLKSVFPFVFQHFAQLSCTSMPVKKQVY